MKKSKVSFSLFTVLVLVLVCISVTFSGCKLAVDKEYKYNTEIISNEKAPVEGEADVASITGYVEDAEQEFVTLPYAVKDTELVITSIGKYTGEYTEISASDNVEDILAIIVENKSDKVVSFSSLTIAYADEKTCSFTPTNIPAHQSALVFTNGETIPYADVQKFECVDSMAVMAKDLPLLEGVVGVDFVDGQFVVTNLTSDNLGEVYIRYKNFTEGNTYLGGVTYSVMVPEVEGYETYKVDAPYYDENTSVIIAVENMAK